MVFVEPDRKSPETAPALDALEDADLLARIGRHRDRAAFEALYGRYEKRAFGLAYHLTGNAESAKDAVQEAMLAIWRQAENELPKCGAGWIMRIVANKSIAIVRKQKVERKHMRREIQNTEGREDRQAAPTTGRQAEDLWEAVRQLLHELPEMDRHVIALRYGADLSQAEIGSLCGVSQRTISNRLITAMERLRHRLTQAGFTAALPLLGPASLGEAICSGGEVPAGLHEQVMGRVAREPLGNPATAQAQGGRVGPIAPGSAAMLAAGILLAASAAGLYVWWDAGSVSQDVKATGTRPLVADAADIERKPSAPDPAPTPVTRWTFEQGPAADLEIKAGTWSWDGKDQMRSGGKPVRLLLPKLPMEKPFVVNVRMRLVRMRATGHVMCGWATEAFFRGYRIYPVSGEMEVELEHEYESAHYFVGSHVLTYTNGELSSIQEYRALESDDRIGLAFQSLFTKEIEVRAVDAADMPSAARDPQAALAALNESVGVEIIETPLKATSK